jgi:hypothetical protein
MTVDISHLAFATRKLSERNGFPPLKHGHAMEIVAAALGYSSLAAYQAAIAAGDELKDLSDARYILVQVQGVATRASELRPRAPNSDIEWINKAFSQCLPRTQLLLDVPWLHRALSDLVDYTVANDGIVSAAMADSNCDGVREIYMPFDLAYELPPVGTAYVIDIQGQVTMDVHAERPPMGRKISVQARLELERLGRCVVGEPVVSILDAKLIYDFADPDDEPREPRKVRLEQALAEELDLRVREAMQLVDVEPIVDDGSSGDMPYGYVFDFSNAGSLALRAKLAARGKTILRVGPSFFDRVLVET